MWCWFWVLNRRNKPTTRARAHTSTPAATDSWISLPWCGVWERRSGPTWGTKQGGRRKRSQVCFLYRGLPQHHIFVFRLSSQLKKKTNQERWTISKYYLQYVSTFNRQVLINECWLNVAWSYRSCLSVLQVCCCFLFLRYVCVVLDLVCFCI